MIGAFRRHHLPGAPPYLQRFGLSEPPFALLPDPRFFYADPGREQALNLLQHLTQYSEELLLVSGPDGAGKSALLRQLVGRADPHWQICEVSASSAADPGRLFTEAARCFGLDITRVPAERLIHALTTHLESNQPNQTAVLVADDVHTWSDDALEVVLRLAELQGAHGRLIRVILFAEPALAARFSQPRFASTPSPHRLEVAPLDEAQTAAYLRHRLTVAGFQGAWPFTERQLKRIFKGSGGIPAAINRLADDELAAVAAAAGGGVRALVGSIRKGYVAAAIGATVTSVAAFFGLQGPALNLSSQAGSPEPVAVAVAPQRIAEPGRNGGEVILGPHDTLQVICASESGGLATASSGNIERIPRPPFPDEEPLPGRVLFEPVIPEVSGDPDSVVTQAPVLPEASPEPPESAGPESGVPPFDGSTISKPEREVAVESATGPLDEGMGDQQADVREPPADETAPQKQPPPSPEPPVIETVEPRRTPGSRERKTFTLTGSGFGPESRVTVSWGGRSKILPPAQVRRLGADRVEFDIVTGTAPAEWGVRVTDPEGGSSNTLSFHVTRPAPPPPANTGKAVAAAAVAGSVPAPAARLHGIQWLGTQPSGTYTVQLAAASEKAGIEGYMEQHRPPAPLAAVPYVSHTGRLEVLLHGSFADKAAADAAAARLPASIRRAGVWVRPVADLVKGLPEQPAAAPPASEPPTVPSVKRRDAWLWDRDPRHFTLQIAGASTREAADAAAARVPTSQPVAIYSTTRDGAPWFIVTWGDFPDRRAAEAATRELPPAIRGASPWPRVFSGVHDDLARSP